VRPVLLAELEIWHSRPVAPTRRVAVGRRLLPVDPAPGFGGLLLGAIVAAHIEQLDPDLLPDLVRLTIDLEDGRRIPQPRLRHRFQSDRHGLAKSTHRLLARGDAVELDLDGRGSPAAQILGAVYAAGGSGPGLRGPAMTMIRRGMRWQGPVGPALISHLAAADGRAWSLGAMADPVGWALGVLGFEVHDKPARGDLQRRFRDLLREAHPDHGGEASAAATRIADLTEARRILLAS
jgi:hypothetical protein